MSDDVFLSYSRKDTQVAEAVEHALSELGYSVWRDRRIAPGQIFSEEIANKIEGCRLVVWLGSVGSITSEWSLRELEYATTCSKPIVPVYLDEQALDRMPGRLKVLFPHTHYILLNESNWESHFPMLVEGVERILLSNQSGSTEPQTTTEYPKTSVEEEPSKVPNGEVGPSPTQDLLPIDETTPMIIGVAVDVSGSMQTALENDSGEKKNRLEGVLEGISSLAQRYRTQLDDPEIEGVLPLFQLFAYGFGFADRAAKYGKLGALARRFVKDLPPVPTRIYKGAIRSLLALSGLPDEAMSLKEVDSRWEEIQSSVWEQRIDLFGDTPMRQGLETVEARFVEEFAQYDGTPHSALLVLSDGESKDGSPVDVCRRMQSRGTMILACYLTSENVAQPKQLHVAAQRSWPAGARTLFDCSTILTEDNILLEPLRSRGWNAKEGDRLFVQLNHSELVREFMSVIVEVTSS